MKNNDLLSEIRSLDPATTLEPRDDQVWDEMFERIVAEPPRAVKTRLWRRPLVAIPAFVALSAAALVLSTAVAGEKIIEVHAQDALSDPRGLEQELARQGVDAHIVSVPSRDLAGKWYHLYLAPNTDIDDETYWLLQSYVGLIDYRYPSVQEHCPIGDCPRTSLLEIPARVHGPITLVVGRTPTASEQGYWTDSFGMNELAPTGALYCYRLEERTPAEAERILHALGYDVSWDYETDNASNKVGSPPPESVVSFAWFKGPNEVEVVTSSPKDATSYKESEGTPTENHPRDSAPWAASCS